MHPRIVAISGPLKGSPFPVGPFELVIGRDRSCDIRLDDPLVSRKHCGISHEGNRPFLLDMQSATGTFVNGFYFPAKMLLNGDRIRVGRSIFVYLDQDDAEVGSAMLMRTPAEEEWDRKVNAGQSGQRAAAYEAAMSTVLDAFLEFNGRINASRDADEIQSRVFELIFRVMPVEGVAILLRDLDTAGILSTTYRSILSQSYEPFPIDEIVTGKALSDGGPIYSDKVVCFPLSTPSAKVGLLYAVMAAEGLEWFTAGHVRLLEAVAGSAAVALERARYVAGLEGEKPSSERSHQCRARHDRPERQDAKDLSACRQSRTFGPDCFDHRRKRNRKRAGRQSAPPEQSASSERDVRGELRSIHRHASR